MRSYPGDLTPLILVLIVALVLLVVLCRLFSWYRLRTLRLCMLTGTGPQRTALRVALEPVIREFLPLLDRAGRQVRAIVLVPTLSGSDGEALVSEVEQLSGSAAYIVRLAHRPGGTVRQPDDVAGALAEDLLFVYRNVAGLTVVRQTAPAVHPEPATQSTPARKPMGRNGLATLPRPAAQTEAEETVIQFKGSPLGSRNGQGT